MLKLALLGLLIVAAAGVLAAAIFMVAKVIGTLILIALFIGACYLVIKVVLKRLTSPKRSRGSSRRT